MRSRLLRFLVGGLLVGCSSTAPRRELSEIRDKALKDFVVSLPPVWERRYGNLPLRFESTTETPSLKYVSRPSESAYFRVRANFSSFDSETQSSLMRQFVGWVISQENKEVMPNDPRIEYGAARLTGRAAPTDSSLESWWNSLSF